MVILYTTRTKYMRPINTVLIIKKIKEEVKTSSGLLLSQDDENKFRYNKAEVYKIGDKVLNVKEGDIIYYDKVRAHTMLIEDEPYSIINENDVVVVL